MEVKVVGKSIDEQFYEKIKRAVRVEVQYSYIDIRGKRMCFSKFILQQLRVLSKLDKTNPKWLVLIELFEHYGQDCLINRRRTIKTLVKFFKEEFDSKVEREVVCAKDIKCNLDTEPLMYLKGVGPKLASAFSRLDINTVKDVIKFYPKKYINYSKKCNICDLRVDEYVTIVGYVKSYSSYVTKNKLTIIKIVISDGSGSIDINYFFNSGSRYIIQMYKDRYKKGRKCVCSGKVVIDNYTKRYTLEKCEIELLSGDIEINSLEKARIVPVYSLNEGLNTKTIRKVILRAIDDYGNQIEDIIPEYIMKKYGFLSRIESIRQIHNPESEEMLESARGTLIFEEFFIMQTRLLISRIEQEGLGAVVLSIKEGGLSDRFVKGLQFELTNGQKRAVNDILSDLESKKLMRRMLQGDVGSGKTVVACMAILAAVENGYQTAIMAPTEILATQHFNNFISWLLPLNINVGLFIGSNSQKMKKKLLEDLKNGQISVAVGTHALIQGDVEFCNLGVVIIDEQHRFGVKQRELLSNKGKSCVHVLTMSATPIPRSLALTVHGDLELTVINELPKGRKEIKTMLINENMKKQAYDLIKREIEAGNQAYIVYPLIEESENLKLKSVIEETERLSQGEFKSYRLAILHGKMSINEKYQTMEDFRNHKFDILIATTVIEVGVDVKDTTVILIENAQRFGLAQLHQLRGRVGRNDKQSYCILSASNCSEETLKRLKIMEQSNDGFIIAQKDLELRGPGEFLGTKQSGIGRLSIADIVRDSEILETARQEAKNFLKKYNIEDFPNLKKEINN